MSAFRAANILGAILGATAALIQEFSLQTLLFSQQYGFPRTTQPKPRSAAILGTIACYFMFLVLFFVYGLDKKLDQWLKLQGTTTSPTPAPPTPPPSSTLPTYTLTPTEQLAILKLRNDEMQERIYQLRDVDGTCAWERKNAFEDWSNACANYVASTNADEEEYLLQKVDLAQTTYHALVKQYRGVHARLGALEKAQEEIKVKIRELGEEEVGVEEEGEAATDL